MGQAHEVAIQTHGHVGGQSKGISCEKIIPLESDHYCSGAICYRSRKYLLVLCSLSIITWHRCFKYLRILMNLMILTLFVGFLDFSSQNCFRFARFAENLHNLGLSRPAHE
jgi:hypothetical protein